MCPTAPHTPTFPRSLSLVQGTHTSGHHPHRTTVCLHRSSLRCMRPRRAGGWTTPPLLSRTPALPLSLFSTPRLVLATLPGRTSRSAMDAVASSVAPTCSSTCAAGPEPHHLAARCARCCAKLFASSLLKALTGQDLLPRATAGSWRCPCPCARSPLPLCSSLAFVAPCARRLAVLSGAHRIRARRQGQRLPSLSSHLSLAHTRLPALAPRLHVVHVVAPRAITHILTVASALPRRAIAQPHALAHAARTCRRAACTCRSCDTRMLFRVLLRADSHVVRARRRSRKSLFARFNKIISPYHSC